MATHTLITGLEEYVRESFVSNPSPPHPISGSSRIAAVPAASSSTASLAGFLIFGSLCVLSQSLVQVQPGVDIIRTNLEFLQEQFNSIAAHVLHCTGEGRLGRVRGMVVCRAWHSLFMSRPQTVDSGPVCWSCVTRACSNVWL